MSMKKQDYERISDAIREAYEHALASFEVLDAAPEVRDGVTEFATELALRLTYRFRAVNDRFRVQQFLRDALGDDQGVAAFQQRLANQDTRERVEHE